MSCRLASGTQSIRPTSYTSRVERQVKERLVGAAVLVAIAVILIPELLSGPSKKQKPAPPAVTRNEQGIKTYQFDLNPSGKPSGQFTSSTAAPPAEQAAPIEPAEKAPAPSEETARAELSNPAPSNPAPTPAAAAPRPEQPPMAPSPREEKDVQPATPAPKPADATTPGWAVQLGSFADAQRANQLTQRLRAAGHNVYLVPLRRPDGKVLQRVRIGPYEQRAAAETALRQVAAEAKGAALVTQP